MAILKRHIAERLAEMLGRRVDVGLYSHIEDIFGFEQVKMQPEEIKTSEQAPAFYQDGTPALDAEGQPVLAEKLTLTYVFPVVVRKVKVDEQKIDHGEQYAYTDEAGVQKFVDAETIARAVADLEANPPAAEPVFTSYENLRARMTQDERRAILTARRADWRVDDFVTWAASAAGGIDLNGDNVAEARAALVAAGVLTEDRAAEIFAP